MTTTETIAPDLTPGYPSNGAKLGPAWRDIWAVLRRTDGYLDGRTLAEEIAPQHDLNPATLVALLSRMARAHYLDRELFLLEGPGEKRHKRHRTHYRIAAVAPSRPGAKVGWPENG